MKQKQISFDEFLEGHDIDSEEYKNSEKAFKMKCLKCYSEYLSGEMFDNCIDNAVNNLSS